MESIKNKITNNLIQYVIYFIFFGIVSLVIMNVNTYYFIKYQYPIEIKDLHNEINEKYNYLNNKINYVDSINKYRYLYLEKIVQLKNGKK